jgi:hypothetical protein
LIAQTNNIRWLSPELIKDGKYGKKSKMTTKMKKNEDEDEMEMKFNLIHIVFSIHIVS